MGRTLVDSRSLTLSNNQRTGHVQIVGATGRGKTQSVILPWMLQDIKNGSMPILIDGKGDEELANLIRTGTSELKTQIKVFNLSDPKSSCLINPLLGGEPQEVADRLIASLEFESSYFRDIQHSAILMALQVFELCQKVPTLKKISESLNMPSILQDLLRESKTKCETLELEVNQLASMPKKDREERLSGLISQIKPFTSGKIGDLVNAHPLDGDDFLDLESVIQNKALNQVCVVILLNSMQFQKTAKVLGKMILQTVASLSSQRQDLNTFLPLYVDEFSSFVFEGFEQFLNKARSRNVGIHISHQSLGDLEAISPSFAKTINVNTNIKVLLGLNDPDTADYFARHLGTKSFVKSTERAVRGNFGSVERSGDMSLRDVEQYKIHPNRLKNYSQGQGVLSLLVSGIPVVEEVQFQMHSSRSPKLHDRSF